VLSDDPPTRPQADRRWYESLLWMVAGFVVTIVMTRPLLGNLSTHVPQDAADPLVESWEVAWSGHALLHQPLHLFRANTFWPEGPSLAFSDSLLGYLPASLIGHGTTAAVVRYNLLFLFAYTLAFAAAALLARELGAQPAAAAVAGAAFAWAPWRLTHNGHLNILSTGGVPLCLFLLLSGYRRRRFGQVVAGWLVAAWQVSLGFALGIYFCYLLATLAVVAAVVWLWKEQRPALDRRMVRATLVGGGLFTFLVLLLVIPYQVVLHRYPDALRSESLVAFYSPPPRGFLAVAAEGRFWGPRTEFIRKTLPWSGEQSLFPGVTAMVMAALGLGWRRRSARLRVGLAVAAGVAAAVSLGYRLQDGRFYRLLYELLPGWSGLRTPGRLALVWSLALALLAAFGAQRLADAVSARAVARAGSLPERVRPLAASLGAVCAIVIAALTVYEGAPRLPLAPVPRAPAALHGLPGPQVHFPAGPGADSAYMFWSIDGFPTMANGNTSYLPPRLGQIRELTAFPDVASVQLLRDRGYRTVVLHRDRAPGTPWENAAGRPIQGLGIDVRFLGSLVIYDLNPD
jgi:hypothetical protein